MPRRSRLVRWVKIFVFVFVAIPAHLIYNIVFHPRRFWRGLRNFVRVLKEGY
jgi:hypothetical protein